MASVVDQAALHQHLELALAQRIPKLIGLIAGPIDCAQLIALGQGRVNSRDRHRTAMADSPQSSGFRNCSGKMPKLTKSCQWVRATVTFAVETT